MNGRMAASIACSNFFLGPTEPAREELLEKLSPVLSPGTLIFLCGQSRCLAVFVALSDTRLEPLPPPMPGLCVAGTPIGSRASPCLDSSSGISA